MGNCVSVGGSRQEDLQDQHVKRSEHHVAAAVGSQLPCHIGFYTTTRYSSGNKLTIDSTAIVSWGERYRISTYGEWLHGAGSSDFNRCSCNPHISTLCGADIVYGLHTLGDLAITVCCSRACFLRIRFESDSGFRYADGNGCMRTRSSLVNPSPKKAQPMKPSSILRLHCVTSTIAMRSAQSSAWAITHSQVLVSLILPGCTIFTPTGGQSVCLIR